MMRLCYRKTTGSCHRHAKFHYQRHCQDNFRILTSQDKVYVAVADGHGGIPYVRSGLGSKFATAAAIKLLQANVPPEEFPKAVKETFDRMVAKHLAHRPLEDWEAARMKEWDERLPAHYAYGTTLMAAVMTVEGATVFQMGDGEIHALDTQGNLMDALPEDPHCCENISTSMVQSNDWVLQHFRYRELKDCSALMLYTDGYSGPWSMAKGLLDTENLNAHIEHILSKVNHGDDQTFVMVYLPEAIESEPFRTGLDENIRRLQERLQKEATRRTLRVTLEELEAFLNRACDNARLLKARKSPELNDCLQKIKLRYEEYLEVQNQLNELEKEG